MTPSIHPSPADFTPDTGARLESWKEIATYLKRGVRTVQRWEQSEALPVHRHHHDKRGTVYAFRSEIDAWRLRRSEAPPSALLATDTSMPVQEPKSGWSDGVRRLLPLGWKQRVAVGVAAVLILLMWR